MSLSIAPSSFSLLFEPLYPRPPPFCCSKHVYFVFLDVVPSRFPRPSEASNLIVLYSVVTTPSATYVFIIFLLALMVLATHSASPDCLPLPDASEAAMTEWPLEPLFLLDDKTERTSTVPRRCASPEKCSSKVYATPLRHQYEGVSGQFEQNEYHHVKERVENVGNAEVRAALEIATQEETREDAESEFEEEIKERAPLDSSATCPEVTIEKRGKDPTGD
uniref:Uncharacterized protein n=1 Tax=Steinernema glaseri TaxID=37863 RepID=A0A1I7Z7G6_9BILA